MATSPRRDSGRKGTKRKPASRRKQATRKPQKNSRAPRSAAIVTRDGSGRFQKGSSGNPAGSKVVVPEEIRTLARNLSVEGILRLAHWMRSDDSMASIAATKIILDRGLGKSIQPLTGLPNGGALVNINMGLPVATAEEAARVYAELCRDPSLDISAVKFAAPKPALIEQTTKSKDASNAK